MVFPRENGLLALSKFVAICALSSGAILSADASNDAAMAVCTQVVSSGDAAVGINIISDASCSAGGLGCIDSICRFCKTTDTAQSKHLLTCASLLPTTAPAATTTAPASTTAAPATTTAAPAATTAVPAASTAAPTTTTCTASSGDIAVGVQAIPDTSCLAGGLGCFTAGCRFCKYSETPKSAHLLTCSSFGYNWPTLAPVPVATVGTGACGISDGDLAVGIRAIDDATCLNGGLGCYSDHCRYCKVSVTPQSAHLADCSSYSIAPTPAPLTTTAVPVSTTAVPVSTTAVPVSTTAVPVSTTAAPAEATPTPSGTIATWTDVTTNTCSVGEDSKAVGIDVVADASVTGDDADYYIDGCRFCKITDSAALASFTLCSLFPNYAAATTAPTVAPTAAPTVCSTPVSAGDAAVGIQIVSDATCVAGGVGCIDSICRFCKISVTPQSAHLTDCAVILDPSATPMPTPASVTTAPAPSTVASTVCSIPVSAGDAAVGIEIVSDATCVAGGVGCIDSICRFCKTSTTPQSAHLNDCPATVTATPAVTTAAPAVTTAATVATCTTPVSEGDAAVGIQIFSDATCVAGGVGCIDTICRFCKISTTPQSAHLIDCPGTAAPATTTAAPATTTAAPATITAAPATTTSTPSATTAQPIFDPMDIAGTTCSLPDAYKSLGIDVVLDPTVTDMDNDYYLPGCRFCKTTETSDSAEFTSCALFAGYGATTTPATSAPVTTGTAAPATTAAPTGGCTQVVSEGDAAVGVQITTDASCVNGGVGCIDSICRFCKVLETPQSTNFVDCSSIVVTTAAPATTTATPATTTVDSVTATVAPATTSLCTVNAGDAAVGIQAIADASCASGGLGCYSDSCRFCKATTTPQSAHLGDCSSYTASTAAPATTTAAPATDGTTTAPSTTTAVPATTSATTTAPIVSGSCTVSDGDAAVGIQAIADATCASGGLGCYTDSCRYCQATPTDQSAHLGLCSSYTASTITTTPAPATITAAPAATTGTTAPITTVAPAVAGTCSVSSGDAAVGIQAFTDATCAVGGIGCYTDSCRYCKTSVSTQSANFVDCPGATTTTTATTTAPAETTAAPSTTTATSAPAETTAAPTTTTAAPATTTAVPATTVAPAGCAVTSGDAAVGIQAFTDATCAIGGIGCYTESCRYCKTSVTTESANFVDCPGTTTATTATTTAPAETTAAPTVDPVAIACAGQALSQGDIDGGVAFTVDTAHCPTGTTVGCVGTASCKFCKEFNSTVSSHLDWCPGYPVTSTSLRVKSSADETTATGIAGKIEKLMKHHEVVVPIAIAACVGVIAVIALVVVGTKRAVRRMRRGSSSMSEFDDDEDEEEGSVLASVTKDNGAATATGVTAEEAEASLSAQV